MFLKTEEQPKSIKELEAMLADLRELYRKTADPVKKEIIIRMARATKIAMGEK